VIKGIGFGLISEVANPQFKIRGLVFHVNQVRVEIREIFTKQLTGLVGLFPGILTRSGKNLDTIS
jgi:hypothetical protein